METEKHCRTLEEIPADRRLVEELYSAGEITRKARAYALEILYPPRRWGLWAERLLLATGAALVLSGIVYLFAFNWTKISPAVRLSSLQAGIVVCVAGACLVSPGRAAGQVLLLSASVLVGVFLAVFGQIYQTGADSSYRLFMMWALLTSVWTLVSRYAAQWFFWLFVANVFLVLWWFQALLPPDEMEIFLFVCMAMLNGSALALREYFVVKRGCTWLRPWWTRLVPAVAALLLMLVPVVTWIFDFTSATPPLILSAVSCLAGHAAFYYVYRYRLPDMWSLSAAVVSGCIIILIVFTRILAQIVSGMDITRTFFVFLFLLMTVVAGIVFTGGLVHLMVAAKRTGGADVRTRKKV